MGCHAFLPETEPTSFMFPALAGGFFTTSATWQAQGIVIGKHEINVLASLFQESGKHMMHLGNASLSKSLKDNLRNLMWHTLSHLGLLLKGKTVPEGSPCWRLYSRKIRVDPQSISTELPESVHQRSSSRNGWLFPLFSAEAIGGAPDQSHYRLRL